LSWLTGCVFVYSALFSIGQLCFGRMGPGLFLLLVCAGVRGKWCGIVSPDAKAR